MAGDFITRESPGFIRGELSMANQLLEEYREAYKGYQIVLVDVVLPQE